MSDDIQAKSPADCLKHCRHSLTTQQYELARLMIKLYGLKIIEDYTHGGWVDQEAAELKLESNEDRLLMIINEGLNMVFSWLDKEPPVIGVEEIGMMIAEKAWQHFNTPPALALAYLISKADENTVAAALRDGRAAREKPHAQRGRFLHLVYSTPTRITT
jgi:hypothetical protein